jgi:hypothetical protein
MKAMRKFIFQRERVFRSEKLKIREPMVAGIKRLKEKLKALMGERPRSRAAEIVVPEREIPGNKANAWERPISKEVLTVKGAAFLDLINLVLIKNKEVDKKNSDKY